MTTTSAAVDALVGEAERSERAGQREIARKKYEAALYMLAAADGVSATVILRRIARTYMGDGQHDAALDVLAAALATAELHDDVANVAQAMNMMAAIHLLRGALDEAEHLSARVKRDAAAAGDDRLGAMVSQNLGIIASMRGDLPGAIEHYTASLASYRVLGMVEHLGPVLNNLGLVYMQLDRLDDAQAAYDEAVTHCAAAGDVPNRLLALINSTSLWLARGEIERAMGLCSTVLAEATAVGDHRALAETYKHLGIIARMRGELTESERQLAAAYEDAMRREDLLLAAETAREQAMLYERMDNGRETLRALSQSHRLFQRLRSQLNLADVQRRLVRLERQFYDIVTRWAQTIESKDVSTLGHCERVADYACALARDVGFDDITMFWFRIGALLHDVGKIVVPSEILNKPGLLTAEEREIMQRHAAAGSELLSGIDFPWDVLPMVRGHHERWDGTGYPDRLAGEAIDLTARITCIADVFDALTTDRPYRAGFSRDEALAMMAANSGRMFDPALFARFEALIRATPALAIETRGTLAAAS
jgi:putative nucleotidyltransferase with HDIG domain